MIEAPIPADDAKRVEALEKLNVVYTPAEERFDRVTRLARKMFQAPIALVSLVDATRQWFKSADGVAASETPRAVSFCGHAITGDDVMVVPDAQRDERFSDNPLVTGDPYLRFYAGYPLSGPDGSRLGTLCVIDREPREFTGSDLESLRDLGAMVEEELAADRLSRAQRELIAERDALKRRAMVDSLTKLWNRGAIDEVLEREAALARKEGSSLGVAMADLDRFKAVNDTHGHPAGDAVLAEAARRMRAAVRHQDAVGRYGGEEFIIILPETDLAGAADTAERIRAAMAAEPVAAGPGEIRVTMSLGVTAGSGSALRAETLVAEADRALYEAKEAGRDRLRVAGSSH